MGRQPDRKNRARALADEALRLAPELREAHLALALCYYRIDADYEKALRELAIASAALPNNSEILDFSGYIYRRQGRWREALTGFRRARELNPRAANFDGLPDTSASSCDSGPRRAMPTSTVCNLNRSLPMAGSALPIFTSSSATIRPRRAPRLTSCRKR